MRKFSSYGPIDTELHYYAPREVLIEQALSQLVSEDSGEGGHYITIWAPRQTGKTWLMWQVKQEIARRYPERFTVYDFSMGNLRGLKDIGWDGIELPEALRLLLEDELPGNPALKEWRDFSRIFSRENGLWDRPLILLIDEADTPPPALLNLIVGRFRELYLSREKNWLHGLALIGVRAVLGVENVTGSPFNVQRSFHIPNLTFEEVEGMFKWYERESGQTFEAGLIERLFYEMQGQPGLTCWMGELLTETFNENNSSITMRDFDVAFSAAVDALPNNNILNIISKANQEPYTQYVLEMFKTSKKIAFRYDNKRTNFLYMNGVVDWELVDETKRYLKFPSPFVQKRLFNYFANDIFEEVGQLYDPFEDLSAAITDESLNLKNILRLYETYLQKNRHWLLENAPRRKDLRIFEAVYHFNLYMYLQSFLRNRGGEVFPEFPTGNGQIDLIIKYRKQIYGLEVKSYVDESEYKKALDQAARYGKKLGLSEITLAFFVEYVDEANRQKYETIYQDTESGVTVVSAFVEIGSRSPEQ